MLIEYLGRFAVGARNDVSLAVLFERRYGDLDERFLFGEIGIDDALMGSIGIFAGRCQLQRIADGLDERRFPRTAAADKGVQIWRQIDLEIVQITAANRDMFNARIIRRIDLMA